MIHLPALPSGYTIFCDDIRHERTGKVMFIGTYTDAMLIHGELPVRLPRLCIGVVFREEPLATDEGMIRVFLPSHGDDTPFMEWPLLAKADLGPPPKNEFVFRETKMFLEMPDVVIEEEGLIRVRVYRGDDEIRIGSLRVRAVADLPEADGKPAPAPKAARTRRAKVKA